MNPLETCSWHKLTPPSRFPLRPSKLGMATATGPMQEIKALSRPSCVARGRIHFQLSRWTSRRHLTAQGSQTPEPLSNRIFSAPRAHAHPLHRFRRAESRGRIRQRGLGTSRANIARRRRRAHGRCRARTQTGGQITRARGQRGRSQRAPKRLCGSAEGCPTSPMRPPALRTQAHHRSVRRGRRVRWWRTRKTAGVPEAAPRAAPVRPPSLAC
mmetsp:Transcript_4299/g.10156  ORF Transcript_4299/g.10156 Transcript_4299/m.10156 type:complete len:213 (+) Transcript_4299:202-840(+)